MASIVFSNILESPSVAVVFVGGAEVVITEVDAVMSVIAVVLVGAAVVVVRGVTI